MKIAGDEINKKRKALYKHMTDGRNMQEWWPSALALIFEWRMATVVVYKAREPPLLSAEVRFVQHYHPHAGMYSADAKKKKKKNRPSKPTERRKYASRNIEQMAEPTRSSPTSCHCKHPSGQCGEHPDTSATLKGQLALECMIYYRLYSLHS